MIQEFIDRFNQQRSSIRAEFAANPPRQYADLVAVVIKHVAGDAYGHMDLERIHCIDDGSYQGTLVFVIAAEGYQPSDYWYVKVSYGSCSGCDTLEAIARHSDEPATKQQLNDYMTLALHIVQGLKRME